MTVSSITDYQVLLHKRFGIVSQARVAAETGIDPALISKWLNGERGLNFGQLGPVLNALGLALLEADQDDLITVPKERYEALRRLARDGI